MKLPIWIDPGADRLRMDFDRERRDRLRDLSHLLEGLSAAAVACDRCEDADGTNQALDLLGDVLNGIETALEGPNNFNHDETS